MFLFVLQISCDPRKPGLQGFRLDPTQTGLYSLRKRLKANSVLLPVHYLSSYEAAELVRGTKTGEPREKVPGIPESRTWLVSHVSDMGLEPKPAVR